MRHLQLSTVLPAFVLLALAAACGPVVDNHETDPDDPIVIETALAEVTAQGLKAQLFGDPLHVGRNVVRYRLTDTVTNAVVRDAAVTHAPTMWMETMSHGTPNVQPAAPATGSNDYTAEIVFIMASGTMGTWALPLTVTRAGSTEPVTLTFEQIAVAETTAKQSVKVGEELWIFTLGFDARPAVGLNSFVLTAHRKGGMTEGYPELKDLAITVTPQMPEMGHGSNGNVNPVYWQNGCYRGSVNLTMAGHWTLDFAVAEGSKITYQLDL